MALNIKRARKTVPLVTDLALAAEHERAVEALEAARRAAKQQDRENNAEVREAAQRVVTLEEQMRGATVTVELEALPRKAWVEFEEANPPREGNDTDEAFKVNVPALDDVIGRSIVAATTPDGEAVEFEWADVTEELSQRQWESFALAVLQLNRAVSEAPFSLLASAVTRHSDAT